ncbi:hypothetical protein F5144DRAFT_235528 [Chaetomium tenue]|uniref:Uncharacterized protein n=1 Tax=Chaetomium tenue TaxID=1854479 RepID=A0ACB7PBI3_9PEZI|nr:hypothetical protein F5144DRAFT_235528 [Chaetomium globosum]
MSLSLRGPLFKCRTPCKARESYRRSRSLRLRPTRDVSMRCYVKAPISYVFHATGFANSILPVLREGGCLIDEATENAHESRGLANDGGCDPSGYYLQQSILDGSLSPGTVGNIAVGGATVRTAWICTDSQNEGITTLCFARTVKNTPTTCGRASQVVDDRE